MDWLILIVVLPIVIIAVVLQFGFAGCAAVLGLDEVTYEAAADAPFNLTATTRSANEIDLVWQHNSAGGFTFTVEILEPPPPLQPPSWRELQSGLTALSLPVTNLAEGGQYSFRVKAVPKAGPPSAFSNVATARTLAWITAYDHPLGPGGATLSAGNLVQRIDKSLLLRTGSRVRITLVGPTAGTLGIEAVYISQAVPAGGITGNPQPDPWDSNADMKTVTTTAFTLQTAALALLPEVDYSLTAAEDLIVAFNLSGGTGRRLTTGTGTSSTFTKPGLREAAVANRSSAGWTTLPTLGVAFIQKIEVLGA